MAINLQALKDEINTNPVSMSYPAFVDGNDTAIADVMNNSDGTNPRTLNRTTVDTGDIRGNTSFDGFDGLVTAEQAWFEWLTSGGEIPVNDETLQQLAGIPTANNSIWAAADRGPMNAAMAALMTYEGSRAEELGFGSVTGSQVQQARLLP